LLVVEVEERVNHQIKVAVVAQVEQEFFHHKHLVEIHQ
jgi:hypothetical protein